MEIRELLSETNAIMEGHFLLTSGLHSPNYVEKFNVLQHPILTQKLCEEIANNFRNEKINTVVGPITGGLLLAHEVGKSLGTRAIFTERVDGVMTFRRGFSLKPDERVLVVEDIVTTGGSVKEVINVVKQYSAIPVGIGVILDRSGGKVSFGEVPYKALLKIDVNNYKPSECPLCLKNIPLSKRGSTGK